MKHIKPASLLLVLLTVAAVLSAVLLPPWLSTWRDQSLLSQVYTEDVDASGEGFIYQLTLADKLRLISEGIGELNSRYLYVTLSEPSEELLTEEQILSVLPGELARLTELKVLPPLEEMELVYSACHTIIDRETPQRNVSYWTLFLARRGTTLSLSMDAENGLIYYLHLYKASFHAFSPTQIARGWGEYLGVTPQPESLTPELQNPVYYDSDGELVPYQILLHLLENTFASELFLLPGDGTEGSSFPLDSQLVLESSYVDSRRAVLIK